jgi:type IX secretion system PorP/SprF family membrane protein
MRNTIKIFTFFIALFWMGEGIGQTPFMSQSFSATNFFNPAAVGFSENNQFQSFYRNQFSGVGDPFKTLGVGVDFALSRSEANDWYSNFGVGLQGVSEQVLNGIMQTNAITVSVSNRVFLDKYRNSFLSMGISTTVLTRNVNRSALTFGDQYYSGRLFNSSSMETVGDFPAKFSTNGGILYSYTSPEAILQAGASTYFINRTSITQPYDNVNQSFQFNTTFNYERMLNEDKTFFLHANYQKRLEASFLYAGGAIGLPIRSFYDNNRIYVGCFYRSTDAVVPYIGLLFNKYKIGMTYDIYQNSMTLSNLRPQTFEFTLSTTLTSNIPKNLKSIFN